MILSFHKEQEHSRLGEWQALVTDSMVSIWIFLLAILIAIGGSILLPHILSL